MASTSNLIVPPLDEVARPTRVSSHEYSANIPADWSYGPAAHGGFLNTIIWKTVALHFRTTLIGLNQPDAISLHFEYLRPTQLGEVRIHLREIRASKVLSTVNFSLQQNGKERVVGFATHVNRKLSAKGMSVDTQYRIDPPLQPIDFNAVMENRDPHYLLWRQPDCQGTRFNCMQRIMYALPRQTHPDQGMADQWICLKDPASRWTTTNLGLLTDWFGEPLENFLPNSRETRHLIVSDAERHAREGLPEKPWGWRSSVWYPTLSMSVDVKRALPEEGVKWLYSRVRIKGMSEGRQDISMEVWDEEGRLVLLVQQLLAVFDVKLSLGSKLDGKKTAKGAKDGSKL